MAEYLKQAKEKPEEDIRAVQDTVREMLSRIKKEGEAAVRDYAKTFDKWEPKSFRVSPDDMRAVKKQLPVSEVEDIDFCQAQIRNFAKEQMKRLVDFEAETLPGVHLGQKIIPVSSSGAYVPGGRYPMLGSAGGADEVWCMGGVYALAAMAYGMEGLAPGDVIAGAGNKYVAEAKKQIYGTVGIDLLAGPTEILVIVDETADPLIVAADLLGQAEHDPNARQCLISLSKKMAQEVMKEVDRQLIDLPTRDIASVAWRDNGDVIVVSSPEEAVKISDEWAPEHLEVQTKDWRYYLDHCRNYGSVFLGEETTVAYGDKTIGTNHVLPTMKAARYTGGLSVGKFVKTVTYQYATKEASYKIADVCERACNYENMLAHGISCKVRKEKYGKIIQKSAAR